MSANTEMQSRKPEAGNKNFLVYNASAGSGKTFTLVKEYLKLALSGDNPAYFRRILAITFTRKAAAEMKERVLDHLRHLAADPLSPLYHPHLLQEYRNALGLPDEMIRLRAERVLKSMLHSYSDMAVSTIDSFIHLIIRTFSRDLRLPMDFEVVLERNVLVDEAVDRLVDDAGKDQAITAMLTGWLQQNTSEGDSWDVAKLLKGFSSKVLFSEESKSGLREMQEITTDQYLDLIRKMQQKIVVFRKRQKENADAALAIMHNNQLSIEDFSNGKRGAMSSFVKAVEAGGKIEQFDLGKHFENALEKGNWFSQKVFASDREKFQSICDQLAPLANVLAEGMNDRSYFMSVHLLKEMHQVMLLHEIKKRLDKIKEERDLLFIDDFNKMISDLVLKDPAPFIYERVGEKYSHIMIDEFQDTSVLQWHNFVPLVENALSAGNKCLIVGDGKQSIYRFRNGEVAQFACLPKIFASENEPILQQKQWLFNDQFQHHTLGTNYRSGKVIVEFNNRFFRSFRDSFSHPLAEVYNESEQIVPEGKDHGFVKIRLSEGKQKNKAIREEHVKWVIDEVRSLKDKGYDYSDICILLRSNRDGDQIAGALALEGIQVVSPDSLLIGTSQHVQVIAGIIRWLTRPEDEENKGKLAELIIRKHLPEGDFYSTIEKCSEVRGGKRIIFPEQLFALAGVELDIRSMLKFSLYQLAEHLIAKLGYDRDEAFMNAFLDQVFAFSQRENDLHAFQEWWSERKEALSVQLPDSSNAVKVMTIHKSKGLQFPVVILPMLIWDGKNKGKERIWVPLSEEFSPLRSALFKTNKGTFEKIDRTDLYEEENARTLLDSMNLMYVAFTRAEEQLIIYSAANKTTLGSKSLFEHIPELNSEQLEYSWGNDQIIKKKSDRQSETFFLEQSSLNDWRKRLKVSFESQRAWGESDSMKAIRIGNHLHDALAQVKHVEQMDEVLDAMQKEGSLPEFLSNEIRNAVHEILNHEFISGLFAQGISSISEMELVDESGNTYRPDRVAFFPDKTVVLDFKTGKPRNEHKDQVRQYGKLLSAIGYPNVENYLFYTSELQLEKVN
jgi:ATP-dependent exoDNAse (exonuclease V) beta subunit